MDILLGILFLLVFITGFCLGLFLPFIIKKYFNIFQEYKEEINKLTFELENKKDEKVDANDKTPSSDIIDEWLNGKSGGEYDE